MLSYQTSDHTNTTGFHRRQNSTPQLSTLSQPGLVQTARDLTSQAGLHRRGKSTSDAAQSSPHLASIKKPLISDINRRQSYQFQHYSPATRPFATSPAPLCTQDVPRSLGRAYSIATIPEQASGSIFHFQKSSDKHTDLVKATADESAHTHYNTKTSIESASPLRQSSTAQHLHEGKTSIDHGLPASTQRLQKLNLSNSHSTPHFSNFANNNFRNPFCARSGTLNKLDFTQPSENEFDISSSKRESQGPCKDLSSPKSETIPTGPETAPFPEPSNASASFKYPYQSTAANYDALAPYEPSPFDDMDAVLQDSPSHLRHNSDIFQTSEPWGLDSPLRISTKDPFKNFTPTTDRNPNNLSSPSLTDCSPTRNSFQSSPAIGDLSLLEGIHKDSAAADMLQRQNESFQCYTQAHSSEIDLDDCVRDTGITVEEVASFIQGPDHENKWECLFEDSLGKPCGKRFARKENAKSHVQTHLGDRQFVCKICDTPFVRQHDLKRHFKIHTTEKPYKCPCGKDFHRHDALTRHRQRGMCVGAFEGSPKKKCRRGRPKKPRPTDEDRVEKAAKTRQSVLERTRPGSDYASSISGSSESSQCSPRAFDTLSIPGSSPSPSVRAFCHDAAGLAPPLQNLTPPASPSYNNFGVMSSMFSQAQTMRPRKAASRSPSPKISSIPEEVEQDGNRTSDGIVPILRHLTPSAFKHGQGSAPRDMCMTPPELDFSPSSTATTASTLFDIMGTHDNALQLEQLSSAQAFVTGDYALFDGETNLGTSMTNMDQFFNFGPALDTCIANNDGQDLSNDNGAENNTKYQYHDPTLGHAFFNDSTFGQPLDVLNKL